MLREKLQEVNDRIEKACVKAGRNIDEVTLIAVSKTKPLSDIEELILYGTKEFGENKVQELVDKYENVSTPVNWHLIGHLQTNKVKYIVDKVSLIHSVDSLKLAKEIQKEAAKKNVIVNILVQVNVANEDTKFGLDTSEVLHLVNEISILPNIRIKGLMTMAPLEASEDELREVFSGLYKISVDISAEKLDNVTMECLSMGMSNDYITAIEENSTIVRLGRCLFR